ncbi:MAG: hypothetical protein JO277_03095 [Candidatus Eremiobacteraeota bacterium]|nr:hypothetical protein [Candidatus Eremiobacteraeota bacterium]
MRPFFVANSTRGIAVIVTVASTGAPIATTNASVAASSPLCHAVTGGRSCTVVAGAAAGTDAFTVKTYDAAPGNNGFAGAQQLAIGKTTKTIVKGKSTALNLTVGGVVAKGAMGLATPSVPVIDNNTQTVTVSALDADGNTIINDGWYDASGAAVTMALVPTDPGSFTFAPTDVSFASPTSTMTYTSSTATSTQVQNGFGELVWATPSNGTPHGLATLTLTAPAFTEFKTSESNSYPEGITVGPDNAIWFVENNGNNIGRITTSAAGGSTAQAFNTGLTANAGLTAIAVAPDDHKLWFTEFNLGKVGSIDPNTDAIHEYLTPSGAVDQPFGITAGADGNMWFAEDCTAHSNIVKFSASAIDGGTGLFKETATANSGDDPSWITSGPDGNLWFTDSASDMIGTIHTDTTGAHDYALNPNSIGQGQITSGPDGELWFTEENPGAGVPADGHRIMRMTTNGTPTDGETMYTFTNTFTSAMGIVTGPDAALWFVENGVDGSNFNYIGRIDPVTKTLDVFQIPTKNANPWGIVKGPDGAIWFTECLSGKIGKLQ